MENLGLMALDTLTRCNALSERYGVTLNAAQMETLARAQQEALRHTGRISFGEGPLRALVYAFCDSPFIQPEAWADTLRELIGLFYALKADLGDALSDEEVVHGMAALFNGPA